ncbi:hypothetical protein DE146DRAFT_32587 [Phaeosphaeria sp. MPI-PUGE-AT-0046c]|nr:hypothetical protein DE146DRAFT_32587 [Phaeosphaeria sp. MPI-PUGE-AT-0046c]
MPRYLQPIQSTQHRVAAIALYRALLSRCSSAPLPGDDRAALRNAVQNRFRRSKNMQSPTMLGLSFKAGYEALDHLDAASTKDTASLAALTKVISKLPRNLTCAPRRRTFASPSLSPQERLACQPPENAVLNVRPYAKTSGPRRVPLLASANGVPFLRLTKPQPPALSRVIRQRLVKKMNVFNTKVMLNNWWLPMAKQEDEWDALVRGRTGKIIDGDDDRVRWVDAIWLSEQANQEAYTRDLAYDKDMTRKMQRIVDLETAMALKEGQTIVRGRKKRPIRILRPPKS